MDDKDLSSLVERYEIKWAYPSDGFNVGTGEREESKVALSVWIG